MKKLLTVVLVVAAVVLGWWWFSRTPAVDLPFAAASTPALDFARLEHELPLTAEQLRRIMPAHLKTLSQEQVDQVYGRLTAGPIPDGPFDGDLFFARGVDGDGDTLPENDIGAVEVPEPGFVAQLAFAMVCLMGLHRRRTRLRIRPLIVRNPSACRNQTY